MTGPTTPWVPPDDTDTTAATTSLYTAIRDVLLGYVDPAVADNQYQLAALLAPANGSQSRIYIRNVPNVNNVKFPYVTLLLDRLSMPGSNTYAERAQLEVQVVGRPAAQGPLIEWIADRIDRCLLSLLLTSAAGQSLTDYGIVRIVGRQRATLPPFTTPAETDVYGVRLAYDLWMYPRVLTMPRAT